MNDVREPVLLQLSDAARTAGSVLARTQRFTIERVADAGQSQFPFGSASEIILLLPRVGAILSGTHDAELPGHAVAILPSGEYRIQLASEGEAYILCTDRHASNGAEPINAAMYAQADPRVRPLEPSFARCSGDGGVRIYPVEAIAIPPENGRLRFLQSETMSINWVEYEGGRGRDALSPHAHADIEQASLAIEGDFVHHLRTPWGRNADLWRDDLHLAAGPGSVVVIPPEIVHTTEGVGGGRHVLVDIFAPPRRDFIARGWMFNADDYAMPAETAA